MSGLPGTYVDEIGVRLIDDAYMAWLIAESECEQALRMWSEGPPRTGQAMYFSYCAALDREEAAARDLQRLCNLAQPCRARLDQGASMGRTELDRAVDPASGLSE